MVNQLTLEPACNARVFRDILALAARSRLGRGVLRKAEDVKTIDTTAAGDTYIGYYISRISKGVSIEKSMKTASRAAAIATTTIGGAISIPKIN